MKKLVNYLPFLLLAFLSGTFNSCEKIGPEAQEKGKLEIAFDLGEGLLKSALSDTTDNVPVDSTDQNRTFHILVSVENRQGNLVIEDELIPLFNFGNGFVSKRIEMEVGEYKLVKFMVINPQGNVVFAAPLTGSPKAYLVMRPLPFAFGITVENVTRVVPEVLAVGNESPEEFGYAGFGFHVVKPLPFYVMAIVDDPRIMAPTQATEALLTVYASNSWEHTFKLEARVNRLEIRGGSEMYTLLGKKEGFPPIKLQIPARQLLASTPQNPVIIPFKKDDLNILTLKPGPREGKDAMISNLDPQKNFGDHPYFEATFISEPILTVMRSNNSLIAFDLGDLPKSATIRKVTLSLYHDKPIIWNYEGGISPINSARPWYGGVLQQIIEPWEEDKVTWENQPKTTEANQVYITPYARDINYPELDYILDPESGIPGMIRVDVTRLFVPVDKVNLPNYGMLFKLWPSEQFPGFRFASSDYPNAKLHPELRVHYALP